MKKTVLSRTYVLDTADTRHTLSATSAADLATQVQEITKSRQFGLLARTAWGDSAADLRTGGVRLVATGAIVRETWRTLSPVAPLMSKPTPPTPTANPEEAEPAQQAQSDTPTAAPNPANPEVAQTNQQLTDHTQSDAAIPTEADSTGEAHADTPNKGGADQTESTEQTQTDPTEQDHAEALSDVADAVDSALSQFGASEDDDRHFP
ncbi:hypothetical protein ACFFLM_23910 [Deinococcus oregonensis]|uniref:Uncharacterized protein n=1 Tax=Deinococcus oregonensis TaxID=1805970 RepID=A0ABV6B5F2_9DEIO